jgi:transposase-like protein
MEEIIVYLQLKIAIPEDKKVSVSSIAKAVDESDLDKHVLRQILEAIQEDEVLRLCGDKYARNQDSQWERAGTSNKTVGTKLGKIKIKLVKVRDTIDDKVFKPLKEKVDLKGKKVYQDDISILGVELASKMTYRDASKEGRRLIEDFPSAHTINRRAKEYGEAIAHFNRSEVSKEKVEIVMADGTKVHGMHKGKNEVKAIIGLDSLGNKSLLGVTVNRSWYRAAFEVKDMVSETAILVGDAEKEMRLALLKKDMKFQLDNVHATSEVGYKLWQENIPRNIRESILRELKTLLYTLKNSVEKHALDGDMDRLEKRVKTTLKGLKNLADKVSRLGCWGAAKFIKSSANYMVTYALLMIKGIKTPYSSNIIERLMGEIAKRVKNKWMHWSTRGLEAIINLILVRYTSEATYEKFYREVQGLGSRFISMKVKVYSVSQPTGNSNRF